MKFKKCIVFFKSIKKFGLQISGEGDQLYVSFENFQKLNHSGILEYIWDLRENHPYYRDRFSQQAWLSNKKDDEIVQKMMKK